VELSGHEILDRILVDAKEKAENILEDAKRSAERILLKEKQTACHKAKKEAHSILKKAKNDADLIRGRVTSDIKRRAGWMVLSEKNRLITEVLDEVKKSLLNLKKSEYVLFLEKLIIDASIVLGGGILEVILNENDSTLPINLVSLEKKISDRTGFNTQIKLSKQKTSKAGVLVKTKDSRIFVDNTFEAILRRRERELRLKIARILFNTVN
jgi:vacuolar-type H+-ATPase subunit E/Vma4